MSGVASGAIGSAISDVAQAVMGFLNEILAAVVTFWVSVPTPDLASGGVVSGVPTHPSDAVAFLRDGLSWVTGLIAVCSLIYGGARLIVEQRRRGAGDEAGYQLVHGMLRLVVVSGGSVALVYLFVQAGDQFSTWIIQESLRCVTVNGHKSCNDFSANLAAMMAVGALTTGVIAVWGAIIMGSLAIFASLVQVILMVLRGAMLVIGLGVLPAAYANFMTENGRFQQRKALTWLTALVLYKPAAAIVYAAGFKLAGTPMWGSGIVSVISGMLVLVVAVLALPALMRFIAPATAAISQPSVAGIAAAGAGLAAVGAGLPTGAVALAGGAGRGMLQPRRAGGGGGASGGGASGGGGGSDGPSGTGGQSSGGGFGSSLRFGAAGAGVYGARKAISAAGGAIESARGGGGGNGASPSANGSGAGGSSGSAPGGSSGSAPGGSSGNGGGGGARRPGGGGPTDGGGGSQRAGRAARLEELRARAARSAEDGSGSESDGPSGSNGGRP